MALSLLCYKHGQIVQWITEYVIREQSETISFIEYVTYKEFVENHQITWYYGMTEQGNISIRIYSQGCYIVIILLGSSGWGTIIELQKFALSKQINPKKITRFKTKRKT